jgi:hypothetical protein
VAQTPLILSSAVDNCTAPGDLTFSFASGQTSFDCSALPVNGGDGTYTVTLDVSDEAGNSSQCTQTITIEDDEEPTVTCKDVTISLDASGSYTIDEADVTSDFSDNCEIDLFTFTPQSTFTCADVSTTPYAITVGVVDESGNSDTTPCISNVTVEDNVAPTLVCEDITIQIGTTIEPDDIYTTLSDACGLRDESFAVLTSPIVDEIEYDCTSIGTYTVTVYVDDVNGNTEDCTVTVTVEDNTSPSVTCSSLTVELDATTGMVMIFPSDIATWSDDCGSNLSISLSQNIFTCADFDGTDDEVDIDIMVTATDDGGTSVTETCEITVEDNTPVTISGCPTTSAANPIEVAIDPVTLEVQFDASAIATELGITINETCSFSTWAFSNPFTRSINDPCTNFLSNPVIPSSFGDGLSTDTYDCDDEGEIFVGTILPFKYGSYETGVISSQSCPGPDPFVSENRCRFYVKVVSDVAPTANCQDVTVSLDATGNVFVPGANVDNSSTDDCGGIFSVLTPSMFDCSAVGTPQLVTLAVTDMSGNSSTCTAMVTVEDNEAPLASCQDLTISLDADGNATAPVATDFEDGSTDNCSIVMTSISPLTDFDCDDVTGSPMNVTYTVTDASGLTATDVCTVTVVDDMGPVLTCDKAVVSLQDYPELPSPNTGAYPLPVSDIFDFSDNCNVTDSLGAFVINCSNMNGDGSAGLGETSFNLNLLVDVNGNLQDNPTTCIIKILGTVPVAECKDITVDLDINGAASIVGTDVDDGSTDECDNASNFVDGLLDYSIDVSSFTCDDVTMVTGLTVPVTLTVTDDDGMTATCVSNVTVRDLIAPMPVCAPNIEVQLSSTDGTYMLMASDLDDPTATVENCDYTASIPATVLDCHSGPTVNVDLTATDPSGNDNTVSCVVNILNPAPVAVCVAPYEVELDSDGEATITAADIDDGSYDFCEDATSATSTLLYTITVDDSDDDDADITCDSGSTADVTLTVTDASGFSDDCSVTVTIKDAPPVAMCNDITVELDMSGNYTLAQSEVDALGAGSFDACGETAFTYSLSQTSFDCTEIGTDHYNLTVTDASGNSDNCVVSVTVEDNLAPDMNCVPAFTAVLDAAGNYTGLTAGDLDAGSMDNCDGTAFTIELAPGTPTSFDCTNVGLSYSVQLNGTDSEGNFGICNSIVTIEKDQNFPCTCIQDFEVFNDIPLADGYRYANINVSSAGQVPANGDVHYKAGESVDLLPGFEVILGGEFLGDIGPCDPE